MKPKFIFPLLLLLAWMPSVLAQPQLPPPQQPVHRGGLRGWNHGTNSPASRLSTQTGAATVNGSNPAGSTSSTGAAATPATGLAGNAVSSGALAPGAADKEADDTYSYNFPATPIDQILDEYARLIGRTLLRATAGASSVSGDTKIELKTRGPPLTKAEAIMALETILGMNGVTVVNIGDRFAKVTVEQTAGQMGGMISTNNSASIPEAGKFLTQIVQLKYAAPAEVTELLKQFAKSSAGNSIIAIPSTGTLILRDYAENIKRMLELLERVDVLTPLVVKPRVIPIKVALAADIASALSALGASGGTSVGKSSSGANFHSAGSSSCGGMPGGMGTQQGGIPGQQGSYPGQPQSSSSNPLSSAASGSRSQFQKNLGNIVQGAAGGGGAGSFTLFGQTKIIADERTNSLLVFANDEDMKMIMDIIDKLDVVLAQVLIEAIVLEVNLQDTKSTGVSYLTQRTGGSNPYATGVNNLSSSAQSFLGGQTSSSVTSGVTNSTTSPSTLANLPGGFSYFGKFGNDLNVVLEAVAGDSRVNVLSRPRIQTSHAVQAELFIGNTVPYVTGTYNYGYGSGPSSQYTEKEVGIRLQVLPLINPEGLVVMDIQTDIEQLGPDVQIAGVGGVPTTTKRQAGAKVAVQDGETIILGGFISATRSKGTAGVPLLKDIPLLGALFRNSNVQNDRTELIVLMRPTVLQTPTIAAKVAAIERNKMSSIKQAERDLREDERARNEAIEAQLLKDAERHKAQDEKKAKKAEKAEKNKTKPAVTETNSISPPPGVEQE